MMIKSFMFGIILLMFIMLAGFGNIIHQEHIITNIHDFTESTLVWNYTPTNMTSDKPLLNRVTNIIHKTTDYIGFTSFEISKIAIEFGYKNPQYDYDFFFNMIRTWMMLILIFTILPQIFFILAIIYFLFLMIKKLFLFCKNKLQPKVIQE